MFSNDPLHSFEDDSRGRKKCAYYYCRSRGMQCQLLGRVFLRNADGRRQFDGYKGGGAAISVVVCTGRIPIPELTVQGMLLGRTAARELLAVLFQCPPRYTRSEPVEGPTGSMEGDDEY